MTPFLATPDRGLRQKNFMQEDFGLILSGRPRFGWVRLRFGVERFQRFRCVSVQFNRKDRFRFRFLENRFRAVLVPHSVSGKTVPTVPTVLVAGSGPVPEPSWNI